MILITEINKDYLEQEILRRNGFRDIRDLKDKGYGLSGYSDRFGYESIALHYGLKTIDREERDISEELKKSQKPNN